MIMFQEVIRLIKQSSFPYYHLPVRAKHIVGIYHNEKKPLAIRASIPVSFYVWINHKADFFLWILRIFCVISKIVPGTASFKALCLARASSDSVQHAHNQDALSGCDWMWLAPLAHLGREPKHQTCHSGPVQGGWIQGRLTSTATTTKAASPSARLCSAPKDYRDPNLMETLSFPPDHYHCLWGLQTNLILWHFLILFLKYILFIYFWLYRLFVVARGLSLVVVWGEILFSCRALSHCDGLSCCREQALGTPVQWLQHIGLVALQHVESSQIRDRTCVLWIDRWILNHWTTREVSGSTFIDHQFYIRMEI